VKRRFEKQLDAEMRYHLDAATQEYIAKGLSPAEARRCALLDFGAVELAKDEVRDLHPFHWLDQVGKDLRYAMRQLRHSPAFAIAVVLTLAVAIGANTAIFSVVRAVLLQPLPYNDPTRLLCIWHGDAPDYTWYTFSHPRFRYFEEHLRDLAEIAAYDDETVTLSYRGEPVRLEGGRVSTNFFSLLGVKPVIGRSFLPDEDRHGANPVALLSDRLWRERYGADPKIIGRAITVDGEEFTIVGVMPRGFQFLGAPVDVWRSRIVDTRTFSPTSVRSGASYLTVTARLHPGATLAQLRAKLKLLTNQYSYENPGNSDILGQVSADLLQKKVYAAVHVTLLVLWGAVACLLVIACANVANLVLARSIARYREISVRIALGASRFRIAHQLVIESLFLSLCSIVLSLPLSLWGMRSLVAAFRRNAPAVPDVHLDAGVMLFTFGIAAGVGVVIGLVPLLLIRRGDSYGGLRSHERGFSASKWSTQLRNGIAAAQIALCIVLLAAAGLLTESFVRMSTMNTGVHAEHVVLFPLDLMPDKYDSWQRRVNFYEEVIRHIKTIPGVSEAAIASRVDLVGGGLGYLVQVEGSPDLGSRNPGTRGRSISPDYFRLLGIPLLRGRIFNEYDTSQSLHVAIVNEAFAKKFFPGVNPIGKHITYSTDRIYCEVIGVIGNVRTAVQDTGVADQIYLPLSQRPWLVATLLVRTMNSEGVAPAIRERVRTVDPEQAVAEAIPMERVLANRLGQPRTATVVVVVFALSALFLAAVGIYGVIAYSVAQKQKEIGIRMALGANSHSVRVLVFRQTLRVLAIGFVVGLPGAVLLNRLYVSLLFAVTPGDPFAIVGASVVLLAVAFIATYLPALRAIRVDPIAVLRAD
jgi:putative ABC transport system permease protein